MGIHKVSRQSSRHGKSYSSVKGEQKETVKIPILGEDSGDDSDEYGLAEFNCELGMVENQMCNIPYELYDLPDLRDILSLETWNTCLTEEERFNLAAFLPDMDRPTFDLTMNEIFNGSDLYFGNPLDVFFKRLKGGFYPPEVARMREASHFLQRKKYYCSLRSYNDRMVKNFIDMRSLWDQCGGMSLNAEEKISIWSNKRKQRSINMLDLNKLPREINFETEAKGILPPPPVNEVKLVAPKFRGKGVLKTKAYYPKVIGCKMPENFRRIPKGVLKIVPRISSVNRQQSATLPKGVGPPFLVGSQGLENMKLSYLPAYLSSPDALGLFESQFLRKNAAESGVHSTMNRQNRQESSTRTCFPSENSLGE